jgi:hypothetical protein
VQPPEEGSNSDRSNFPSSESQQHRLIADAIGALGEKYGVTDEKHSSRHSEVITWQKRAAWGLAAYTLLTFILVLQGRENIDANIESNAALSRAWMQIDQPVPPNLGGMQEPLALTMQYRNSGREPAFGVVGRAKIDEIPAPKGDNIEWNELPVWNQITDLRQEAICDGVIAKSGREVVYIDAFGGTMLRTEPNNKIQMDGIKNRIALLIVYGCVAYKTPSMPKGDRHSTFCWFYRPELGKPSDQWQVARCPIGNYAD